MDQEKFQTLNVDYVIAALRAGCGIIHDWSEYTEDELQKIADAAAAGHSRLVLLVPEGAKISIDKLEILGRSGAGYVSVDFSRAN